MTTETEPLTLHGLRVENFKRVSLVELDLSGAGIIQIRGKNKAGKSSIIDALWAALGGARVAPDEPIHKGKRKSTVAVDLGKLKITRSWSSSGTRLEVHYADGTAVESPQALLNSLVSQFVDPCTFLQLKPEEQAEQVLAMSGLGAKLGQIEIEEKEAVEIRRDVGRDLKREEGALASARAAFKGIPEGAMTVADAAEQLADENQKLAKWMQAKTEIENVQRVKERHGIEIENLEQEIQSLQQRHKDLFDLIGDATVREDAAATVLRNLPVPAVEAATDAFGLAKESASAFAAKELGEKQRALVENLKKTYDQASTNVEEIREGRGVILENAKFPVEGMAYDAEVKQLILNDVPFPQASSAERLKAAIEIAIAGSPGVRVLFVREASLLDEASLKALEELATKRGYQVMLEVVDDTVEGPGVYIEDGRVADLQGA